MKIGNWAKTLLVLTAFLAAVLIESAAADTVRQSDRIRTNQVQPGQEIVLDLHEGLGKDIKGRYVASAKEGITVRRKNGEEQVVPWGSIRVVKAKNAGHGLWIGLTAGAALAGVAVLAEGSEGPWAAAFISIGAGLGCMDAAAATVGDPPAYKAPKGEDPGPERRP